jgi:2-dehydropantoate 2-reductase
VTIAILGPGGVGGALAVPLALMGERVICVARPQTADAIAREGLTLVRVGEEFRARPEATDVLREPVDVLLITVKAPALEDALSRIDARAELVLPLLNGFDHMTVIRSRLDGKVAAGTIALIETYRESPTRIVQTTRDVLILSSEPISLPGFEVRVVSERELLWDKAVRMAPLAAATAATLRPLGELRAEPAWRDRLRSALDESVAVARAEGVDRDADEQWRIIEGIPHDFTTSAARDVAAGRPNELDAITGAVIRAGKRRGVPTPTLEQLLEEACLVSSR